MLQQGLEVLKRAMHDVPPFTDTHESRDMALKIMRKEDGVLGLLVY